MHVYSKTPFSFPLSNKWHSESDFVDRLIVTGAVNFAVPEFNVHFLILIFNCTYLLFLLPFHTQCAFLHSPFYVTELQFSLFRFFFVCMFHSVFQIENEYIHIGI